MDKIHKLGELPSYLKKRQLTELKVKSDEEGADRPATFPENGGRRLRKQSTLISNNQFHLKPKAVDKVHKLGHLPSFLKKKRDKSVNSSTENIEREVSVTSYCNKTDSIEPKNYLNEKQIALKTPPGRFSRQDTSSTLLSRISNASSLQSTRIGTSKSFDPNAKPRFNNSGKHPLLKKQESQDDFLKNYKIGEVPKYLKGRLNVSRKRCNSPEPIIGKEIDAIGDFSDFKRLKDSKPAISLDAINELSEKPSKESEKVEQLRPNTVACVDELLKRKESVESIKSKYGSIKNLDDQNINKNRHSECFKAKNSLIEERLHKLGFKPKYLKADAHETQVETIETPVDEKIDQKIDILIDETPTEPQEEVKLSRDSTFILNIEEPDNKEKDDVDNKNNVSHPAAVVDISPKLDPLLLQMEVEPDILINNGKIVDLPPVSNEKVEKSQSVSQQAEMDVIKGSFELALQQITMERDAVAKQLKFERQRFCGRDKSYKEVLERYKDILKQFDLLKKGQKEKEVQIQQMKNQLRDSRERNSKVIKEKSSLVLDLQSQLATLKEDNGKLNCEVQQITNQFHEAKSTFGHRISQLTDALEATKAAAVASQPAPLIKPETSNNDDEDDDDITDKQIKCKSKHLKLMENEYEKMCEENKRVTQLFEEMRKRYNELCQDVANKNDQILNLKHQIARKNLKLNEMMNSCEKGMLLIDRIKQEIHSKLDKLRVYYTTLTYKEAQIDKLEARCIDALAYDERVKIWLEKLDDQLRELKRHKSRD